MSKRRLTVCPLCSGMAMVTYDNFEAHAIVPMTCFACDDTGHIVVERSERVYEPAERRHGDYRLVTSAELKGMRAAGWDIAAALMREAFEDGAQSLDGVV